MKELKELIKKPSRERTKLEWCIAIVSELAQDAYNDLIRFQAIEKASAKMAAALRAWGTTFPLSWDVMDSDALDSYEAAINDLPFSIPSAVDPPEDEIRQCNQ